MDAKQGAQQPQSNTLLIIVVIVVGYLVWTGQIDLGRILPKPRPTPSPEVVVPSVPDRVAPTGELLSLAQALQAKLSANKAKAAALEAHYAGLAELLRGLGADQIATAQGFRAGHAKGLELINQRPSLASPSVGAEIDAVLAAAMGLDAGGMDAERRAKAATGCDAIAWACWAARQGG